MLLVRISLLIVTFLSLISWVFPLMQVTKEVNPHPCIAPHVNMHHVFLLFWFFFLWHLLNCGFMEGQGGGWHVRLDHVLWYRRFPMRGFVLNPDLKSWSSPSHLCCTSLGNSIHQCGEVFKELNMYKCVHSSLWRSPLTNPKCKPY